MAVMKPVPRSAMSRPVAQEVAAAEGKPVAGGEEFGGVHFRDAKIDGARRRHHRMHHGFQFAVVARVEHLHVGQRAHDGEVLGAVVRGAAFGGRHAAVGTGNLHVKVGVGGIDVDLIEGLARGEGGKRGGEGHITLRREAGGDPEHVGFSDPALDEAVGKPLLEEDGARRGVQVGVEDEHIFVPLAEFDEGFAEDFAERFSCVGEFHGRRWRGLQARSAVMTASRPPSIGAMSGRENFSARP
jgi:hypothetical protein